MIILGDKVRLHGIRAEVVLAMTIAERLYDNIGQTLVITSVTDGKHMRASIHYTGGAFDIGLPINDNDGMRQRIANGLGPDFDVVLEGDHIHVEWQPKAPY